MYRITLCFPSYMIKFQFFTDFEAKFFQHVDLCKWFLCVHVYKSPRFSVTHLSHFQGGKHKKPWQKKNIISDVVFLPQVTTEPDTKETMPPVWSHPTKSFTLEVSQPKMDLARQRHSLRMCTEQEKVYLLLPVSFNLTSTVWVWTDDCNQSPSWAVHITAACFTQDIWLWCAVCFCMASSSLQLAVL